ncbi:hypothetical protein [Sphaerisporangium sp. TRM90804]|uniref:hypothetical protein n=1 Tax=Sphaerisporangium sp. TRM90804 TaxID=3031113 RepID=UPI00244B1459|nr:hypothetical protein [Sphaerisporangium sp. TRM90804]MDH2424630.1 hypothetical protein [Sphaerisporangium sp. TRM90804]
MTGSLDLEACTVICPLTLEDCLIEEPVDLSGATVPAVRLPGSRFPSINARQLQTRGDLDLGAVTATEGVVNLVGAHIGGSLNLSGATLANPGGDTLIADRVTVDQGMFCGKGFTATGQVGLVGARIGGQLVLNGAALANPGGDALFADGLAVDGDVFCREGFTATGQVSLIGAHIRGQFDLNGATLTNPGGVALVADGLTVDQGVFCGEGFTATGQVRLVSARIGATLDLSGAALDNPGGHALSADRLTVDQGVFCGEGFTATGEVRLAGAHIGGQFDLTGATLANPGADALTADRLTVGQNMLCGRDFTATGQVRLAGAHIGGRLELSGAALANPGGLALDLEGCQVAYLSLHPARGSDGAIDLTSARVGVLSDDQGSWPSRLHLRGFAYDSLAHDRVGVRARLTWLGLHQDGYTPQIYDQLSAVYRRAGREEDARKVAIAKLWHRRRVLNPGGRLVNWLLYLTVGYGYRTWLAGVWLAALTAVGTWVFAHSPMTPTVTSPPAFVPLAYTLDVLLPIVDLGQDGAWRPQAGALYLGWALIAAGWILTTAVVAGLTGVLKRT